MKMRRLIASISLFIFILLMSVNTGQAIMKIAFPPATRVTDPVDDAIKTQIVLSLYLRDAFATIDDIRVADEDWTAAVLDDVRGNAIKFIPDTFFSTLIVKLPVDAFIDFSVQSKDFTAVIYTRKERHELTVAIKNTTSVKSLALALGTFIANELKLSPEQTARFKFIDKIDPAAFEAIYCSRRLSGSWITNNGDARFSMLNPFILSLKDSPEIVRAVLEAGIQLTADQRKPINAKRQLFKARVAVIQVLGTSDESLAMEFLRVNKIETTATEDDLLACVKHMLEGGDEFVPDGDAGADLSSMDESLFSLLKPSGKMGQYCGAIRGLGVLHTTKALTWLKRTAVYDDANVRCATAYALGQYINSTVAQDLLQTLQKDADETVVFAAFAAKWNAGTVTVLTPDESARLVISARAMLQQQPDNILAVRVLAKFGEAEDIAVLKSLNKKTNPNLSSIALNGLFRLDAVDNANLQTSLDDCTVAVAMTAVRGMRLTAPDAQKRLIAFCNNPYAPLADAARLRVEQLAPKDEPAKTCFMLDIEHRYVRRKIVMSLADSKAIWATEALQHATTNANPHVRAQAIAILVNRAPEIAAPLVKAALDDPYYWVNFRAATLAPAVAKRIGADTLRVALANQTDPAVKLYLTDALAIAEDKPLPTPAPGANQLDPKHAKVGLCGYGAQVSESPIEMYYNLDANITDIAKKASANGKVFISRINVVGNPCQVLLTPGKEDAWMMVRKGLQNWPWLDGVVFGEESMSAPNNDPGIWQNGWRVFCREAGIDVARVHGDRSLLLPGEQRAWEYWEQRVAVEGFNELYDFVHLYYGKLRPGFMVSTFMPDQDTLKPLEAQWKFDVGGAYDYGAPNRARYTMIRRYRTVWPDRPIMWLSLGEGSIGGEVRYSMKVPEKPILKRNGAAYSDSVCAWMAGADPGLFLAYLFMDPKTKGGITAAGKWLDLESIGKDLSNLDSCVEYSFQGVADIYKNKTVKPLEDPDEAEPEFMDTDDKAAQNKLINERIDKDKVRIKHGFLLEQQYLYNVARVLSDLPRPAITPPTVLWVTNARNAVQLDWFNTYDVQFQLNSLSMTDLAKYRVIGILGMDKTFLRENTITSITHWLHDQPGLLYLHKSLSSDRANKAGTPDDFTGPLINNWPWANDVIFNDNRWELSGAARIIAGTPDAPTLVYWKKDDFRGGVLFDLTTDSCNREDIAEIIKKEKVGCLLDGRQGIKTIQIGKITAAAATGGDCDLFALKGVDLLTGEPNPIITKGRNAAIVADDFLGHYVCAKRGLALLGAQPLTDVTVTGDSIQVTCAGLLQIGSITGHARITTAVGKRALKTVTEDNLIDWLLYGSDEGIATVQTGDRGAVLTYIRCKEAIMVQVE